MLLLLSFAYACVLNKQSLHKLKHLNLLLIIKVDNKLIIKRNQSKWQVRNIDKKESKCCKNSPYKSTFGYTSSLY